MPGTPDPALGSDTLTRAVSIVASVVVLAGPSVMADRWPPLWFALGVGIVYAGGCLGCWLGARLVTGAFPSGLVDRPIAVLPLVFGGVAVLGIQAAVPVYGYARYGVVVPLLALAVVTNLVVYTFLQVRGETDPLGLYALFFGPAVVVGLAVLVGLEVVVRRFVLAGWWLL
ncbi:hypothetical protein ACFQL1_12110 [Halomicroarcula sp. GCM10025709]|uniref:hypothetical protein n=1 Tax=Haloarcula TaxID=2237 RepID=UPI0024C2429E|nr:hypothetical protein [Halomicroarcula sp. YJ-61-S]